MLDVLLCLALAAPVPPPRPLPPLRLADVAGVYAVAWFGTDYTMLFNADGSYQALCPRTGVASHAGFWRLEGGRLLVREWPLPGLGGAGHDWEVRLTRGPRSPHSVTAGIVLGRAGDVR